MSSRANACAWHFGGGAASGAKHTRGSSVTFGKENMKYVAPAALAIIALFQAFASWCVIQMVQHQSEHHAQTIIEPTLLYVILVLGIVFVIGCTALEIFGKKEGRNWRFLDLGVIGFTVYSIPASIILFYIIKPWLRQILYL
ncbi:MAG: hypothetical protein WC661_12345 [Opitutaceae bacterium]|jgi:hypothetical protein